MNDAVAMMRSQWRGVALASWPQPRGGGKDRSGPRHEERPQLRFLSRIPSKMTTNAVRRTKYNHERNSESSPHTTKAI